MLINAGIKNIFYQEGYADSMSRQMLQDADVDLIKLDGA
jgi:deoxycytidylate deaminase